MPRESRPWRGLWDALEVPMRQQQALITKRASLGNESQGGFMPFDLPISWASHLALITAGTSAGVLETEGFEFWLHR